MEIILLYGPPGTGKTHLARAAAGECGKDCTFFSVSAADLVSRWMGESERLIRLLFESSRKRAPSVVFIDELDAFCKKRGDGDTETSRRMKTEFLTQLDGLQSESKMSQGSDSEGEDEDEEEEGGGGAAPRVLFLAATNLPWELDTAVLRRFELRVHVPLPGEEERCKLLVHMLKTIECCLSEEDVGCVAARTEGFSGSDLAQLVKLANMLPVREALERGEDKGDGDDDGAHASLLQMTSPPQATMSHFTKLLNDGVLHRTVSDAEVERHASYETTGF